MWRATVVTSTVVMMSVPHLAGLWMVTLMSLGYGAFLWVLLREAR